NNHQIAKRVADGAEVFIEHLRGGEVIDGNVEKALNLRRVQVHAQHPIGAHSGDQVRHQLCCDRHAPNVFAVLARISEVRDDRGDALSRSAAEAIDVDQQLHQVVVDGVAGGLHDKAVAAAHVFIHLHNQFAIGERFGVPVGHRQIEVVTHGLSQSAAGAAGKNLQLIAIGSTHGVASTADGAVDMAKRFLNIASTSASCCGVLIDSTSSGGTA